MGEDSVFCVVAQDETRTKERVLQGRRHLEERQNYLVMGMSNQGLSKGRELTTAGGIRRLVGHILMKDDMDGVPAFEDIRIEDL